MTISRNPTILAFDPRMIDPPSLDLHPVLSRYHSDACAFAREFDSLTPPQSKFDNNNNNNNNSTKQQANNLVQH
jgi:hypothetical protein